MCGHFNKKPEGPVMNQDNKPFSFHVKDTDFRTSSWTGGVIARCVKVAITPSGVALRDSKDAGKTTLFFKRDEWDAFLKGAKAGEFELNNPAPTA